MRVSVIDTWLELLKDTERLVVEKKLIEGLTWEKGMEEMNRLYDTDECRSQRTPSNYLDNAIEKITSFATQNRAIISRLFAEKYRKSLT